MLIVDGIGIPICRVCATTFHRWLSVPSNLVGTSGLSQLQILEKWEAVVKGAQHVKAIHEAPLQSCPYCGLPTTEPFDYFQKQVFVLVWTKYPGLGKGCCRLCYFFINWSHTKDIHFTKATLILARKRAREGAQCYFCERCQPGDDLHEWQYRKDFNHPLCRSCTGKGIQGKLSQTILLGEDAFRAAILAARSARDKDIMILYQGLGKGPKQKSQRMANSVVEYNISVSHEEQSEEYKKSTPATQLYSRDLAFLLQREPDLAKLKKKPSAKRSSFFGSVTKGS